MATPPGFVPTPPAPVVPPPAPPAGDPPSVQERVNALNERNAALVLELATAKAAAAEVAALRQRATLAERRADSAAHPQLRHPDVAAHVSSQYDAYAARTGEAAKGYADWLTTEAATSPLVSPYLATAAPPPVPGQPAAPPVPAPPNPNGTALPTGAAPPLTVYSEEAVQRMDAPTVRANVGGILDQMVSEGKVAPFSDAFKARMGLVPKPTA